MMIPYLVSAIYFCMSNNRKSIEGVEGRLLYDVLERSTIEGAALRPFFLSVNAPHAAGFGKGRTVVVCAVYNVKLEVDVSQCHKQSQSKRQRPSWFRCLNMERVVTLVFPVFLIFLQQHVLTSQGKRLTLS